MSVKKKLIYIFITLRFLISFNTKLYLGSYWERKFGEPHYPFFFLFEMGRKTLLITKNWKLCVTMVGEH